MFLAFIFINYFNIYSNFEGRIYFTNEEAETEKIQDLTNVT